MSLDHRQEPVPSPLSGDVRAVLDLLRQKLLDLSTRNRLLSFGHRKTNCLRIVDELPDQLFEALLDGKSMELAAVAEPSDDELAAWHEALARDADEDSPLTDSDEEELPPPPADVWARHCGLSTSYDLPEPAAEAPGEEKHADLRAQTLLYPDDLDRRARKLTADARTAIEESGVNMFHLALGFLEWTEPKAEGKTYLAPLILVPIEIRRTRQGSRFRYTVAWSGEDLQENLSLRHKLDRDFGLVLPEFPESMVPESYFTAVGDVVAGKSGWRVRRMASFALFNFSKLQIYLDLDPDRWPVDDPLEVQPLVKSLLGGEPWPPGDGSVRFAEMADTDQARYIDLDLDLVDNADSSQARALVSALGGDSLVVRGPPGTGKSQTITNLTAAALAAGKTVLFVSEKLAALEVVRRRMHDLGLGDFCLELHSNKTRKSLLLQDVARRLDAAQRFGAPERLRGLEEQLREERERLNRFVELGRSPQGRLNWPLSRVLFEGGKTRHALAEEVLTRLPGPGSFDLKGITEGDRRRAHESLAGVAQQIQEAGGAAKISGNPWRGISSGKVLGHDVLRVASSVRSVGRSSKDLRERIAGFFRLVGIEAEPTEELAEKISEFPEIKSGLDETMALAVDAAAFADEVESLSKIDLGVGRSRVEAAVAIVDAVAASPRPQAVVGLESPGADALDGLLDRIAERIDRLQAVTASVASQVDLKEVGRQRLSPHAIRRAADVIRSAGFIDRFGSDYRQARELWQSINLPGASRPDATILRDIAQLAEMAEAMANDEDAARLLGKAYRRDRTDVETLRATRRWYLEIAAACGTDWGRFADLLFRLDKDVYETLVLGASHPLRTSASRWLVTVENRAELADALGNERDVAVAFLAAEADWIPADHRERLTTPGAPWRTLIERSSAILVSQERYRRSLAEFAQMVGPYEAEVVVGSGHDLAGTEQRALKASDAVEDLGAWLDFDRVSQGVDDPAARKLTDMVLDGDLAPDILVTAYDHLLFDRLARAAIEDQPELRTFLNLSIDDIRERYRELDEATMELRRARIAAELASRPVPEGRRSSRVRDLTDRQLLQAEIKKKRRHLPIRKLVERAGGALQSLKPCFMMGPASVAQYLVPGEITFDLVIMDEASQLRPEDAVGALARARQAVIVGDSKQLPPTSFFNTLGDSASEEEDDELVAGTMESILDQAETLLPARTLNWHYRSRHPSLIQFSNKHFYDGDLVVFPSPDGERDDAGVSFEYLAEAICESGVNGTEARAVAVAAIEHLRRHPTRSLGVAAMNIRQKEQIEAEVDALLMRSPDISEDVRNGNGRSEPFFIKNLENVQGDERDVIFISMTYGRSAPGQPVPQRFGPINQELGWRRLNVLFTRAKEKMVVFSSLRAEDVRVSTDSKRGVTALRSFLHWAEHGHDQSPEILGKPPDSTFEIAVIDALETLGYRCTPQVGVAGFFVDIGIQDPDRPGAFVLGIECDGAQYHSTLSARDRDRLRQTVLEDSYGWKLERIWSTDWFQDPDRVLTRVAARIEAEREARKAREAAAAAARARGPAQSEPDIIEAQFEPVDEGGSAEEQADATSGLDGILASLKQVTSDPAPQLEPPRPMLQRPKASIRISTDDARQQLVDLREYTIRPTFPEADPTAGLLRRSMLDTLLRERPVSEEEWLSRIPRGLREATDPEQLREFGDQVFEILEMIGD